MKRPTLETARTAPNAWILALVCGLLSASATVRAQVAYTVTDLGTLPGTSASSANGLNDRGEVVGACAPGGDYLTQVGFVWRNGVMVGTGKLNKGNYSVANAISRTGIVVGDGDTGNFRPQSWVKTGSGLLNIFPNNGGNTHAIGVNDAGTICGFFTRSLSGWASSWRPALWRPDPKDPRKYLTTVLPILVGPDPAFPGTTAIPSAFNQMGEAAGYASNEAIGQHACLWKNDASHSIVDLGTFPGDWSSLAWGINDLGQVVGTSHPPFGSRPVVWNNDPSRTPTPLPLPPGDNAGTAVAINNLGHAIGTSYPTIPGTWDVAGPTRLVVWRDGGVFDLQSALDPTTGAGWILTDVRAINNAGQIVGSGIHNGVSRAFLLTPIPR